jgi:hypothetical protein
MSMPVVNVKAGTDLVTVFPHRRQAITPDGRVFEHLHVHCTSGRRRFRNHSDLTKVPWKGCTEISIGGKGGFLTIYVTDEEFRTMAVYFVLDKAATNAMKTQAERLSASMRRALLACEHQTRVAFAMVVHPRLGAGSWLCDDLFHLIVNMLLV